MSQATIRGLTLQQPYASAVAIGPKRIENRPRNMIRADRFPMWVGLHAGKTLDPCCALDPLAFASDMLPNGGGGWDGDEPWCTDPEILPRGVMLGAMHVDWMEPMPDTWLPTPRQALLLNDDWAEGPWCLHITEVRLLDTPIPCRGMNGLWPVPEPIHSQLLELIR